MGPQGRANEHGVTTMLVVVCRPQQLNCKREKHYELVIERSLRRIPNNTYGVLELQQLLMIEFHLAIVQLCPGEFDNRGQLICASHDERSNTDREFE